MHHIAASKFVGLLVASTGPPPCSLDVNKKEKKTKCDQMDHPVGHLDLISCHYLCVLTTENKNMRVISTSFYLQPLSVVLAIHENLLEAFYVVVPKRHKILFVFFFWTNFRARLADKVLHSLSHFVISSKFLASSFAALGGSILPKQSSRTYRFERVGYYTCIDDFLRWNESK